jgi:hypothetical protein
MSAAGSNLPQSTSQATSAPRSTERQARIPATARPARSHRLPHEGLGGRTGPADQWKRRGAHHRSTGRQSLEEELQSAAFDGTARYVWRFGGNNFETVRAVTSAAGCARHAVVPSARADEHKQISLRSKPRAHVARVRHDCGPDGNTAKGRRGPPHVDKSFPLAQVGEAQTYILTLFIPFIAGVEKR